MARAAAAPLSTPVTVGGLENEEAQADAVWQQLERLAAWENAGNTVFWRLTQNNWLSSAV